MEHRVDQLSKEVLSSVRESLGTEDGYDTSKDGIINHLSSSEIFEKWCNYEGLIHYGPQLKRVVENIWKIKLEEK